MSHVYKCCKWWAGNWFCLAENKAHSPRHCQSVQPRLLLRVGKTFLPACVIRLPSSLGTNECHRKPCLRIRYSRDQSAFHPTILFPSHEKQALPSVVHLPTLMLSLGGNLPAELEHFHILPQASLLPDHAEGGNKRSPEPVPYPLSSSNHEFGRLRTHSPEHFNY